MNLLIKSKSSLIICFFISIFYFILLDRITPLGINWRDHFEDEFNNAIHNILNNFDYTFIGLTNTKNIIQNSRNESVYITPALYFLHFALIKKIFGDFVLKFISPVITNAIIVLSGILVGKISVLLLKPKIELEKFILSISSFIFFLFSPWTYKMVLAPHREIYFFFALVLSLYLSLKNINKASKIIFIIGCFYQYQWAFLIGFFNILLLTISLLLRNSKIMYSYLIFHFNNYKEIFYFSLLSFIPTFLAIFQNLLIQIIKPGVKIINSSAFSRIGIDSSANIFHGGYLGALQFLGGNRIGYCFSDSINLREAINNNLGIKNIGPIFSYHCALTIFSCFLLSILSMIGIFLLLRINNRAKKALTSLIFAILLFLSFYLLAHQ